MSRWSPYTDNGGTVLAIAGEDFCLIAADTRQSEGYSINSRYAPKAHHLTDKSVLATAFMYADSVNLVKRIRQRIEWYAHQHDKQMSTPAIAQMLSTMLYHKRFFPYYVFNVLGGVDEKGKGCVFSYDPVGNVERKMYSAAGSASALIQPFLDNQCGLKNMVNPDTTPMSLERAMKLAKDAFSSATERDIYTGDCVEIFVVRQNAPVECHKFDLKRD